MHINFIRKMCHNNSLNILVNAVYNLHTCFISISLTESRNYIKHVITVFFSIEVYLVIVRDIKIWYSNSLISFRY